LLTFLKNKELPWNHVIAMQLNTPSYKGSTILILVGRYHLSSWNTTLVDQFSLFWQ